MDDRERQLREEAVEREARILVIRQRVNQIIEKFWAGEERWLDDQWPLIATILAAVEAYKRKEPSLESMDALTKSKPLSGLSLLEMGFGGRDSNHLIYLSQLGAKVAGIEPSEKGVYMVRGYTHTGAIENATENDIQQGLAQDTPKLFGDRQFDLVVSSRLMEEAPLARDQQIKVGEQNARDILANTFRNLKPEGLSIHTTTMPFLLEDKEQLKRLGYDPLLINERFDQGRLGVYYYSILEKPEH